MTYTYKKGNVVVTKANRYTHAKKGYTVFFGRYPSGGFKYFRNKINAIKFAKRK